MRAKTAVRKVAQPVRVNAGAYARLQRLAERVTHDGWRSLGAERTDLPTFAAVIDEALLRLDQPSR